MKNNDYAGNQENFDPLCAMAGQCATELINEEVVAALKAVEWEALKDVSLNDWFEKTIQNKTEKRKPISRSLPRRILLYVASMLLFVIVTSALILATHEPARAAFIRFIVE